MNCIDCGVEIPDSNYKLRCKICWKNITPKYITKKQAEIDKLYQNSPCNKCCADNEAVCLSCKKQIEFKNKLDKINKKYAKK